MTPKDVVLEMSDSPVRSPSLLVKLQTSLYARTVHLCLWLLVLCCCEALNGCGASSRVGEGRLELEGLRGFENRVRRGCCFCLIGTADATALAIAPCRTCSHSRAWLVPVDGRFQIDSIRGQGLSLIRLRPRERDCHALTHRSRTKIGSPWLQSQGCVVLACVGVGLSSQESIASPRQARCGMSAVSHSHTLPEATLPTVTFLAI